jgi:uncharacterized protein (DUF2336 family)
VLVRSPLLTDLDLIDRVAGGDGEIQRFVAMRAPGLHGRVGGLAEVGEPRPAWNCCRIPARGSPLSFRRMVERHGHEAVLREALIADPRLPSDCRHMLLVKLGEALLRTAPLVLALMGETRAERMTRAACLRASVTLIEATPEDEYMALVEHLRLAAI